MKPLIALIVLGAFSNIVNLSCKIIYEQDKNSRQLGHSIAQSVQKMASVVQTEKRWPMDLRRVDADRVSSFLIFMRLNAKGSSPFVHF